MGTRFLMRYLLDFNISAKEHTFLDYVNAVSGFKITKLCFLRRKDDSHSILYIDANSPTAVERISGPLFQLGKVEFCTPYEWVAWIDVDRELPSTLLKVRHHF